jgi:hypothetical protein
MTKKKLFLNALLRLPSKLVYFTALWLLRAFQVGKNGANTITTHGLKLKSFTHFSTEALDSIASALT